MLDITGHPGYRVCGDGTVWSCWKLQGAGRGGSCVHVMSPYWKQLKGNLTSEGYVQYTLRGGYRYFGHTLVLTTFIGPCPEGYECRHLNGCRVDNYRSNLAWGTKLDNAADRHKHGTQVCGSSCYNAKLDEKTVRYIRYGEGKLVPTRTLASTFLVSRATIRDVRHFRTWKHV